MNCHCSKPKTEQRNRASKQSIARRPGRRRYAGAGHGSASYDYAEHLHTTTKLMHELTRRKADGNCAAMVTELGGGTPASPCVALRPYQALLASRAVAVGRWENDGAAVVTEERRGASQGRQWRRRSCCGAAAALRRCGKAKEKQAVELRARRGHGRARARA